jgi:tetraacyldisaccharide 4'-kinase
MSRLPLAPLASIYGAGVAAKNLAYDRHWLKAKRLRWPVVSIGNLSVGGSGKTPLTLRLAELLKADGCFVDVLSRGYGRTSRATEQVNPAGEADRFGDEPLLIARRAGVPVYVGASRYEAGLMAENPTSQTRDVGHPNSPMDRSPVHLLDDGFQHRQLARHIDIVVIHRSDLGERMLPAGRLREPLSSLRRVDFLAVREEDADLEPKLRTAGATAPIWRMRRTLTVPAELKGSAVKVIAFCGIARPDEFFSALIARGVDVELTIPFADHHRYTPEDIHRLATAAKEARAGAFLTTEKDAVKLIPTLLQQLEAVAPVRVARLEVSLRDEASVIAQLRAKLPL